MPDNELDFGYEENETIIDDGSSKNGDGGNDGESTNLETGKIESSTTPAPSENLNETEPEEKPKEPEESNKESEENPNELVEGTEIEADGNVYTVDKDGNLLDSDGKIFKNAADVKAWLDSFEEVKETENDGSLSISNIQDAVGIDITDENDQPIEFENSIEGIRNYINAVVETSKQEHYEAAINTLEQKFPILKDVLNYYLANGNSLEGFNDQRSYAGVDFDEDNENQHEAIIRTAWAEQNRKGDIDGYIAYLKSSGTLSAVAQEELAGLQELEKQHKAEIERQADLAEQKRIQDMETYWTGVKNIIDNRKIAGYTIPESIIITRNGGKLSVTPNDFFEYLYRVDKEGRSAYERDLMAEKFEDRMHDEILRAYLKFVGGNYSNLVDMAVNEKQVNRLKLKSKETRNSTIRMRKPKTTNSKESIDIDLGYD